MSPSRPQSRRAFPLPLLAAAALILGLYAWIAGSSESYWTKPDPADQNYNLLVQGFRSGHLSLNRVPPPGLERLADPYDPEANAVFRNPPFWLHDLSYYRGRLYLYFGVTPALLLFWPWAVLTGHPLSQATAVGFFCAASFLIGGALLLATWRRYFPELGAGPLIAAVLTLGLATGMPILLQRAEFWEVATSCAQALTIAALGCVWLALHRPRQRLRWLAAGSLAFGLGVGARPSVFFGAAILLVPVALAWREAASAGSLRPRCRLLAAAALPFALCGAALMLYNYFRFHSPFEFGQRYQLAADRQFAGRHFSLDYLWFNFRVYFLEPAHWRHSFPFVQDIVPPPLPPGHSPIEDCFGALTNMPVLWLALAAPLALRSRTVPSRAPLLGVLVAVGLLFASSALVLDLFYGSCLRYEVEFLPLLGLLAGLGILGVERALAGRASWRIAASWILASLLVFSCAFNLLASLKLGADGRDKVGARLLLGGQTQEAIVHFGRSLRLDPNYARTYGYLAVAYLKNGDYDRAIAECDEAIRRNPSFAEAYNDRATAEVGERDYDRAIAGYNEAIRLNPSYIDAYNDLAWLRAVCPEKRIRNGRQAVDYARKACAMTDWKDPSSIDTLAAAYAESGNFAEAVKWETKFIENAGYQEGIEAARQRLNLYALKKAYHEEDKPP